MGSYMLFLFTKIIPDEVCMGRPEVPEVMHIEDFPTGMSSVPLAQMYMRTLEGNDCWAYCNIRNANIFRTHKSAIRTLWLSLLAERAVSISRADC